MSKEVDMTYRFLWDKEPTDAQLRVIMQEVGEDVRRQQQELKQMVLENIRQAAVQARTEYQQVNLS